MTTTAIEWTDTVWNPTTGCDRVSPGCDRCYALTMAKRLKGMGSAKYQRDGDLKTSGPGFGITEHSAALDVPLSWRKPRKVFVNSMSDLFHAGVSDEFIAQVWAVMGMSPAHTFQILTKRHGRLRSLLSDRKFRDQVHVTMFDQLSVKPREHSMAWPLPNVWLGVSVEDQKRAELRIPALLDTPARIRFLSCEPLLGPLDLSPWFSPVDWPACFDEHGHGNECYRCIHPEWVIVGGESGPGSRPMQPDWVRTIRDQVTGIGAGFFFKQWGETAPLDQLSDDAVADWEIRNGPGYPGATMCHVGKKRAGRLLDGRTWDEYPAVPA